MPEDHAKLAALETLDPVTPGTAPSTLGTATGTAETSPTQPVPGISVARPASPPPQTNGYVYESNVQVEHSNGHIHPSHDQVQYLNGHSQRDLANGNSTEPTAPQPTNASYRRYHIHTQPAPQVAPHPHRFRVKVSKVGLLKLLVTELIHYRFNRKVVLSRPCLYGVFSGPVGGFAPRDHLCVGCLRCTTQYPDMVQILPNADRLVLGDSFYRPEVVDIVNYEAETGQVPVRGAGYRGKFGGEGWDGMWTDMSEIVRPTRDGIHGREFISTVVDIGTLPDHLTFDADGQPTSAPPKVFSLPIPLIYDVPPPSVRSAHLYDILSKAAEAVGTLAILPLAALATPKLGATHLFGPQLVPLVEPTDDDRPRLEALDWEPRMIEVTAWDPDLVAAIRARWPECVLALRLPCTAALEQDVIGALRAGVDVIHLVSDFHGRGTDDRFMLDIIRAAHLALVAEGRRNEVTLIGSGGITAAEHLPKAILCGLDVVALDTPLLVALQARFEGECRDRETSRFVLPKADVAWSVQRLQNLAESWRNQLLEIMGAMGLREVRRLRGEMGRAMFQADLEREAFGDIEGFEG